MSSIAPSLSSLSLRPQRVLACVLCQQRKVKCDRKFPCANCVKSRATCVPSTLAPRQRRRRFPERELLDRLRQYEDLMRQNNISFEPLHEGATAEKTTHDTKNYDLETHDLGTGRANSIPSASMESERNYGVTNAWHTMNRGFRDPENESDSSHDEVREIAVKIAWDETIPKDDNLLFGSREATVELSSLHPDPVQIFRLWQIYLDNINPLLRVTHTPTLQGRIIEAASNVKDIKSTLEALMFGIYCTAITSLHEKDCQIMFGSPKEDLLRKYQFGCHQSLLNCKFLRSRDRECLTALYLYLVSVRPNTVPHSLASLLGVAIRIAQRMGLHSELALAKCPVLEAEMRRRLWWSLAVFDHRMTELSSSPGSTLDPTWDCRIPLNVNDSDLRPDMKESPSVQGVSTEALYAVVSSELWDYIRHTMFHLDFRNPALKPIAKYFTHENSSDGSEIDQLEQLLENRYLKNCDPDNPLHFMTIWRTRAHIARFRLMEHHLKCSKSNQNESNNDVATSHALNLLDCDTKIMTSPLTKGFRWLNRSYFPFPAYFQLAQVLKARPLHEVSQRAWKSLSDNYEAWFDFEWNENHPIYELFVKVILQAWEACEAASTSSGTVLTPPTIVLSIRRTLARLSHLEHNNEAGNAANSMDAEVDDLMTAMPVGFDNQSLIYNNELGNDLAAMRPEMYSGILGQSPFLTHMGQYDWSIFDGRPNWPGY